MKTSKKLVDVDAVYLSMHHWARQHYRLSICEYRLSFTNIEYYYTNTVSEAKIQRDLLILILSALSTLVIKY